MFCQHRVFKLGEDQGLIREAECREMGNDSLSVIFAPDDGLYNQSVVLHVRYAPGYVY